MLERALRPSPINPTVDFSAEGVQHGFLRLPYSRDDSAWGWVLQPSPGYIGQVSPCAATKLPGNPLLQCEQRMGRYQALEVSPHKKLLLLLLLCPGMPR